MIGLGIEMERVLYIYADKVNVCYPYKILDNPNKNNE